MLKREAAVEIALYAKRLLKEIPQELPQAYREYPEDILNQVRNQYLLSVQSTSWSDDQFVYVCHDVNRFFADDQEIGAALQGRAKEVENFLTLLPTNAKERYPKSLEDWQKLLHKVNSVEKLHQLAELGFSLPDDYEALIAQLRDDWENVRMIELLATKAGLSGEEKQNVLELAKRYGLQTLSNGKVIAEQIEQIQRTLQERTQADQQSRLDAVVSEIRSHLPPLIQKETSTDLQEFLRRVQNNLRETFLSFDDMPHRVSFKVRTLQTWVEAARCDLPGVVDSARSIRETLDELRLSHDSSVNERFVAVQKTTESNEKVLSQLHKEWPRVLGEAPQLKVTLEPESLWRKRYEVLKERLAGLLSDIDHDISRLTKAERVVLSIKECFQYSTKLAEEESDALTKHQEQLKAAWKRFYEQGKIPVDDAAITKQLLKTLLEQAETLLEQAKESPSQKEQLIQALKLVLAAQSIPAGERAVATGEETNQNDYGQRIKQLKTNILKLLATSEEPESIQQILRQLVPELLDTEEYHEKVATLLDGPVYSDKIQAIVRAEIPSEAAYQHLILKSLRAYHSESDEFQQLLSTKLKELPPPSDDLTVLIDEELTELRKELATFVTRDDITNLIQSIKNNPAPPSNDAIQLLRTRLDKLQQLVKTLVTEERVQELIRKVNKNKPAAPSNDAIQPFRTRLNKLQQPVKTFVTEEDVQQLIKEANTGHSEGVDADYVETLLREELNSLLNLSGNLNVQSEEYHQKLLELIIETIEQQNEQQNKQQINQFISQIDDLLKGPSKPFGLEDARKVLALIISMPIEARRKVGDKLEEKVRRFGGHFAYDEHSAARRDEAKILFYILQMILELESARPVNFRSSNPRQLTDGAATGHRSKTTGRFMREWIEHFFRIEQK